MAISFCKSCVGTPIEFKALFPAKAKILLNIFLFMSCLLVSGASEVLFIEAMPLPPPLAGGGTKLVCKASVPPPPVGAKVFCCLGC